MEELTFIFLYFCGLLTFALLLTLFASMFAAKRKKCLQCGRKVGKEYCGHCGAATRDGFFESIGHAVLEVLKWGP